LTRSFLLKLSARKKTKVQCLLDGHRCLFGLELVGDIHERSCRGSDRHPFPPDGVDLLVVGAGVDDDARRATESSVPPWEEQMDLAGDVVAQIEQRERALVRDGRFLRSDGHPLLADVVVLGTREALNAIEAPPHPLESFLLDVMVQKLAADAMFPRLRAGEVAALLVGVGFETADVRAGGSHA
jgi:hypothetical protein